MGASESGELIAGSGFMISTLDSPPGRLLAGQIAQLVYSAEFPIYKRVLHIEDVVKLVRCPFGIYSFATVKTVFDASGQLVAILNTRLLTCGSSILTQLRRDARYLGVPALLRVIARSIWYRTKIYGSLEGDGSWHIEHLAVCPTLQGQGVGRALLKYAEEEAKTASAPTMTLEVLSSNVGAKRLYERQGFVAAPPEPPSRFWRQEASQYMIKEL
ncbi:MAG: GNAT family N-acetyltransferase [Propionibacteriaceae bacterium]|jgi:ribosomal protein S18 acetylase RimI-like enzyme|nr:GNAT family N-acetyltransferase [Propionibacteriaceae bacterium]